MAKLERTTSKGLWQRYGTKIDAIFDAIDRELRKRGYRLGPSAMREIPIMQRGAPILPRDFERPILGDVLLEMEERPRLYRFYLSAGDKAQRWQVVQTQEATLAEGDRMLRRHLSQFASDGAEFLANRIAQEVRKKYGEKEWWPKS